jgi:hypothetical protein
MNSIKPICLSAFAVLVLAGCGAQKNKFQVLVLLTANECYFDIEITGTES